MLPVGAIAVCLLAAQEPGAEPEAPIAAVAIAGVAVDSPEARGLRAALRQAIAKQAAVRSLPEPLESVLFFSVPPPPFEPPLDVAEKHLRRAEKAFRSFDLDDAEQSIGRAAQALRAWEGLPEARDLFREQLHLSVSIAHARRNEREVERALAEYARRFPGEKPPPKAGWPPRVIERLADQKLRTGKLTIEADPRGDVYVDGSKVGAAPVTLEDLPAGPHRVVVIAPLHFKGDAIADVAAGRDSHVSLRLQPDLSVRIGKHDPRRPLAAELAADVRTLAAPHRIGLVLIAAPSGASGAPRAQGVVLRRVDVALDAEARESLASDVEVMTTETASGPDLAQAIEKLLHGLAPREVASAEASLGPVPLWAAVGVSSGAIAAVLGTALRLSAVSTQSDIDARDGAITQTEAYGMRSDAEAMADSGALLIGVGAALAIASAAGWLWF